MKAFSSPHHSLGDLDAEAAGALIAAATDITLILDPAGQIRDVALQNEALSGELAGHADWAGRRWVDLVTPESRPKVEALLADAVARGTPRWRQITHPRPGGPDLPLLCTAVAVGEGGETGRIVAFGRDLRAVSALQQRLVDAQQSLERDYARLRTVEARYRMLFQGSAEAVLVVDVETQRVTEANPAATQMFDASGKVVGQGFAALFDADSRKAVLSLLGVVGRAGRADDVAARLPGAGTPVAIAASPFRQDGAALLLVRVTRPDGGGTIPAAQQAKLLKIVENAPDGFVVTTEDGRIVTANGAFLDMAELATLEQADGQSLDRWVGQGEIGLDVLLANLRQHGAVRLFRTTLRGEYGTLLDVEISAVSVMNGGQPCHGFAIRNIGRRIAPAAAPGRREMPRSVEQLTELIGQVPLRDLVRETTDVVERLCIEAALELTNDNRASAAEVLGLSRQSLYVKLRRYGLGDLASDAAEERA